MDRLINHLFIFALIGVFVLDAGASEHQRIILGALFALGFCLVAFLLNWLSLDGARAGTVLGTLVFGLGGFSITFLVLFFFLSSTLISIKDKVVIEPASYNYTRQTRRDGLQVWSNGFWFSIFLMMGFVFEAEVFWVAAISALATATADTWATELGSRRFNVQTYLLNGLEVDPGTEGGVSVPGTLAGLTGSLIISFFAVYLFSLTMSALFIIFIAGFLGCLADSYFGAVLQGTNRTLSLPFFKNGATGTVDNNMVNWISTGVGSLLAIMLTLVFG